MTTHIYYSDTAKEHITPPGHPECIERYDHLKQTFITDPENIYTNLTKIDITPVDTDYALGAHTQHYIDSIIKKNALNDYVLLDSDTIMSPHTLLATQHALGAAIHATDSVFEKRATNCFSIQRPPGHHAESQKAMGFCIFNYAACAAFHARKKFGVEKVAVIDFDVHHGNGTQDIFWNEKNFLYCSTHQMPLYPGTGSKSETGLHHNICNAPLRANDGSYAFKQAYNDVIFPFIINHRPDFIIISAGFDAHTDDPLAGLLLTEDDFEWITAKICEYANTYADNRIVSILEGGYNIPALTASVSQHIETLMQV